MEAFEDNRVSEACFAGTTGYGYDDLGRETLDKIYAQVFRTEAALVRTGFVNGTHALSAALYALLAPGEILLAATGAPYDTLRCAIGTSGDCHGSLKFYGIGYRQVELGADGAPDLEAIRAAAAEPKVKAVLIQRSRGYEDRRALTVAEIGSICDAVRAVNPAAHIMVDNCYGEFTDTVEPTEVGADIIAGSLIKNPGGGIAQTGGYIAGKAALVEQCAYRLTCVGMGKEVGCSLNMCREMYLGLFFAPEVVANARKTGVFAASLLGSLGFECLPKASEKAGDIITVLKLRSPGAMEAFCGGIQAGSPVDSYVTPEAWDMPGYESKVIMAAGTFTGGASIELSADGPMREPYAVYLQGGLTYGSGKLGILTAAQHMLDRGLLSF
jgi:cystathionine beta-lyase family protein involved in aluminum resistance